jgi:hypothetical protein
VEKASEDETNTFYSPQGILDGSKDALKASVVGHDYDNQLALFIEGKRAVIGDDSDFNPRFVDVRGKDGTISKHANSKVAVPKNITTIQ